MRVNPPIWRERLPIEVTFFKRNEEMGCSSSLKEALNEQDKLRQEQVWAKGNNESWVDLGL
ncbi:hypothetical protein BDE02_06G126600 [Populus trichocarpa]|nr:hypothetical protein BDE02_06G126600 [Populus trichocarpa]